MPYMPYRDDSQSRKLEQLLGELAELRARVTEQCRLVAEEREKARAAQARALVVASRRQRQERADAEDG
jgi:hypothetical protein